MLQCKEDYDVLSLSVWPLAECLYQYIIFAGMLGCSLNYILINVLSRLRSWSRVHVCSLFLANNARHLREDLNIFNDILALQNRCLAVLFYQS